MYAYCQVDGSSRQIIVAEALVATLAEKTKKELTVVRTVAGKELVGKHYRPPFDYYYGKLAQRQGALVDGGSQRVAWRVVAAPFVTIDSVPDWYHLAPAFGEVDFELLTTESLRFQPGEGPNCCVR